MKYNIRTIASFDKQVKALAKKYPSFKQDLIAISETISTNPTCGIHLGNDVYKIRMPIASKGKGKSSGARIIYFNLFAQIKSNNDIIYLSIYDKSDKETISDKEIKKALSEIS